MILFGLFCFGVLLFLAAATHPSLEGQANFLMIVGVLAAMLGLSLSLSCVLRLGLSHVL